MNAIAAGGSTEYLRLTETAVSPSPDRHPQQRLKPTPESPPGDNEKLPPKSPQESPGDSSGDDVRLIADDDSNPESAAGLNLDLRPASVNLIEFSPNEPGLAPPPNDKRKSSETESPEDDDDNSIYQQVKYFRRSVHEINSLLLGTNGESEAREEAAAQVEGGGEANYDSLETGDGHVYENVENVGSAMATSEAGEDVGGELPEKVNVRSLTSRFEAIETTNHKPNVR